MNQAKILVETTPPVTTIIINRPQKLNAFRGRTCDELIHALTVVLPVS